MRISIPRRLLAAVALTAAKQDTRSYLNGVYLEPCAGHVRLVATDGNIAAVARFSCEDVSAPAMIIPSDVIAEAVKSKSEVLSLSHVAGGKWELSGRMFDPVEGRFPEYRRVMPQSVTGEPAYFSAKLLGVFAKCGKALKAKGAPIVRQNGVSGAAVVHFYGHDDFMGVIMPLNPFTAKRPDLGVPNWAAF